jgi:transposase
MPAIYGCPGAAKLRGTPTITDKICPECGREIELFSIDAYVKCDCGFVAYNDAQSCINWCKYARECVGDDIYERLTGVPK